MKVKRFKIIFICIFLPSFLVFSQGNEIDPILVKLMLLLKVNALTKGHSGVQLSTRTWISPRWHKINGIGQTIKSTPWTSLIIEPYGFSY